MAHAFKIMNTTGTITTYTDYDSIPLVTLKHVISFIPDLGTKIDSNEILLVNINFIIFEFVSPKEICIFRIDKGR